MIGTISPLGIHGDETISTMKFADRAMKVQVRAKANEINPEEDKLVQKLRREVIHLREILQMHKNKTQKDINLELLNLKEENCRLKGMNSTTEEVEKLKRENKELKQYIQEKQYLPIHNQDPEIMSITNGEDKAIFEPNDPDLNNNSSTDDSKEYEKRENFNDQADYLYNETEEENVYDKENNQNNQNKGSSFFITETDSERRANAGPKKNIKPPLPSIMDVLSDSKARETVLSTNKKQQNDSSMKKSNPLMLTNFERSDPRIFSNYEELTPIGQIRDYSRLSNLTDGEAKTRVTREMGLNEIRFAAQDLSQNMVNLERCSI